MLPETPDILILARHVHINSSGKNILGHGTVLVAVPANVSLTILYLVGWGNLAGNLV